MSFWPFGRKKKKPVAPPATVKPGVPQHKSMQGLYVFCGWANLRPEFGAVPGVQCPAERPWDALQTDDRQPAMGFYDERDPEVTREYCRYMERGGFDFAAYQVEWAHEHTQPSKRPSWRKVLDNPLTMSHCADNHPIDTAVKFCVSWWDVMAGDEIWKEMKGNGWTTADVIESQRMFAREVATRHMNRPNYLHIDGKPVLMRGTAHTLDFYEREFGISPRTILNAWRIEVGKVTGKELYLIATSVEGDKRGPLKSWGFNALTEYLLHGKDWESAQGAYRHWWSTDLVFCRAQGLEYWVPITSGFDAAAWGNYAKDASGIVQRHLPTPAQFTAHVRDARKLAADNADVTRAISIVYAGNEIGEGGIVFPMAPGQLRDGDSMLRAHKAALA